MEEKKIQGKIAEKTEAKPEEKKIKVERETYTKDDKTYFWECQEKCVSFLLD